MNSSKTAFAATAVVLVLAIAAAIFAFYNMAEETFPDDGAERVPQETVFVPPDELLDEMDVAARRLLESNRTLMALLITEGLPVEREPYGNNPPDDVFFVSSDVYRTLDDIENLIRETFIPEEAERVINNRLDDGSYYYNSYLDRVYYSRSAYGEPRLGIHMNFEPDLNFPISWESVRYTVTPITAAEAELSIKLMLYGTETVFERTMLKLGGEWHLDRFIHHRVETEDE